MVAKDNEGIYRHHLLVVLGAVIMGGHLLCVAGARLEGLRLLVLF